MCKDEPYTDEEYDAYRDSLPDDDAPREEDNSVIIGGDPDPEGPI